MDILIQRCIRIVRSVFMSQRLIIKLLLTATVLFTLLGLKLSGRNREFRMALYFPEVYRKTNDDTFWTDSARRWMVRQPPKRQACVHPDLYSNLNETRKYFQERKPIDCSNVFDWTFTSKGRFFIKEKAVKLHGNIQCSAAPVYMSQTDGAEIGTWVETVVNNSEIVADAFEVECKAADSTVYKNIHFGIKPTRLSDDSGGGEAEPEVNVLMYGLDSLSRPMFRVQLPKTHEYFAELGGLFLEGYNIVGDGTTQALTPMLTGNSEEQLPEARRSHSGATSVDSYPFVWKEYEQSGYVTLFGEDEPVLGAFNYRLLGFTRSPVNHYMRPFYVRLKERGLYEGFCHGEVPRYQVALNSLKEYFDVYNDRKLFAFVFQTELSHGDNNLAQTMDEGHKDFLKYFQKQGYLNKTIVIMFSDHGARFSNQRETERGKLEERMPYVGFLFPDWFKRKYRVELDNFEINSNRLSTPYDIHATLLHILHHRKPKPGNIQDVGISLFDEIPPERTCAHARVDAHWCACMKWEPVYIVNNTIVDRILDHIISQINKMLLPHANMCRKLKLKTIIKVFKYSINSAMLSFKRSVDVDGRVPEFTETELRPGTIYSVTFRTFPGGGVFETTVHHSSVLDQLTMNLKDISRTNKYGNAPQCLQDKYPELRPFCYCYN